MIDFKTAVPFDPGFSEISFSFIENIQIANAEFARLKANHQKKFWLAKFEPTIIDFLNRNTAFYLGCMLWGSFIHYRFKDSPKQIEGNTTATLTEDEFNQLDCACEVKATLEYIKSFERDCKYFLNRNSKLSPEITKILENYIEFASLNNNFRETLATDTIKIPEAFAHFKVLSNEQLDTLYEKIKSAIESKKIENLLDIGFYKQ